MSTDDKLQAFEDLMHEASAAIADMVEVLRAREADDGITQALADIAVALEKRGGIDMSAVAQAIRSLRELPAPVVNVVVRPAEVVVQRSALDDGATIELRMPGPPGGRDKVMLIRKLPPT